MLVVALAFLGLDFYTKRSAEEHAKQDYAKIEQMEAALKELMPRYVQSNFDVNEKEEYWMDGEFIESCPDEKLVKLIREKLGDEFKYTLTNGDQIIIHACTYNINFELYVKSPGDDTNMIYPDWKYSKLSSPDDAS